MDENKTVEGGSNAAVRFCSECGAPIPEGSRFCTSCGARVEDAAPAGQTVSQAAPQTVDVMAKVKALPKKAIAGICAGIVALIVIIAVASSSAKTINLDDYLVIETSGYDGFGTARATVDWDAVEAKYGDRLSFTKAAEADWGGFLSFTSPMELLRTDVFVYVDDNGSLSNGDDAGYKWTVNSEIEEYIDGTIKYSDGSFTVEGLEEIGSFDPFADIEVTFSGISPNGSASYEYTGSDLPAGYFSFDKSSGLRNGDKVTLSVDIVDTTSFAERNGKLPSVMEKSYEVEGLGEYIESYADLSESDIADCRSEAEDSIYASAASTYSSSRTLSDLEYAGYIFDSVKDAGDRFDTYDDLYLIYKGMVSDDGEIAFTENVYYPVRYSNLMVVDGELTYDDYGVVGSSRFGSYGGTSGYTNPLVCYTELTGDKAENYTIDCGDGFELYSDYDAVGSLSDISDDYRQVYYNDALSTIENYINRSYLFETSAGELTVAGEYLLTAKDKETEIGEYNKYYVVYSATVSNSRGYFDTTTVYYPVEYDGVVKLSNGEYLFIEKSGISGTSRFSDAFYYTNGYIDGKEMFSRIVTTHRDNYTYEVSDGLKVFGE